LELIKGRYQGSVELEEVGVSWRLAKEVSRRTGEVHAGEIGKHVDFKYNVFI